MSEDLKSYEHVKAYLDDELSPTERASFEAEPTSAELEAMRLDFQGISAALRDEAPTMVIGKERTLMSLNDPANRPTWRGPVSMLVRFGLAAGVAILIFAPQVYFGGGLPALLNTASEAGTKAAQASGTLSEMSGVAEGSVATKSDGAEPYAGDSNRDGSVAGSMPTPESVLKAPMATKRAAGSATLGPVGVIPDKVTRYPQPKVPHLATPERARERAEAEYRSRAGGTDRPAGGAVPLERLEGLPSPIQGKIAPFNPPMPTDDPSAPPLEELARSVTSLASQFRAETIADTELAGAPGKRGRSFVFSVRAEYANSFVTKLRSSIGAYGSVSAPSLMTRSKVTVPAEDVAKLQSEMEDLIIQREGLLKDFYEDAKPVVEVTKRIDDLRARIEKARSQPKGVMERRIVSVTVLGA
ncbi:MAG: hypothetical protein SFX74_03350 [Fimbriimonadaceae bacterium]|nr:hypothetical protein [Fimbriimonadaceae bacterium]